VCARVCDLSISLSTTSCAYIYIYIYIYLYISIYIYTYISAATDACDFCDRITMQQSATLQHIATHIPTHTATRTATLMCVKCVTASRCNALQHCNTLQYTHCNTRCNTHCNTDVCDLCGCITMQNSITLQRTATHIATYTATLMRVTRVCVCVGGEGVCVCV